MELFLNLKDGLKPGAEPKTYTEVYAAGTALPVALTAPGNLDSGDTPLESEHTFLKGMPYASIDDIQIEVQSGDGASWSLAANMAAMKGDIDDLLIICHYTVAGFLATGHSAALTPSLRRIPLPNAGEGVRGEAISIRYKAAADSS